MSLPRELADRPDSEILPHDDGVPLESDHHRVQMDILISSLQDHLAERGREAYVAGNNFLYYQRRPLRSVGPDVYIVLGRPQRPTLSYVVWEEGGRYPDVIVELLSKTTERVDRGKKLRLYRDTFRTPEYYLYDPLDGRFEGFRLQDRAYVPLASDGEGRLPCQAVGLLLGRHEGWLRWFTPEGELVPTVREKAVQEQQRAEWEHKRAESARRRAEAAEGRAEAAEGRAEEAEGRAEAAEGRAEEERRRRAEAENRARALEEELRRLRGEHS